ncbi:hypothetical protein [Microvirga ossetica]|uniref:hypothetical protein n=1 Tax=Microvirga ossetica TaxID=1882682 RepID=UPI0012FFE73C|nr:hypothetical protein [Microvirga ossetica]
MAACVFAASAAPSQAEMTAREFLTQHSNSQNGRAFLAGLSVAYGWIGASGNTKIFCPPESISITIDQNIELIKRYLATAPDPDKDDPLGLILLVGLRSAFPCKK